jgi:hypothetical protein
MDHYDVCKIIDYYISTTSSSSSHRESFQRALLCSPRVVERRLLMVFSSVFAALLQCVEEQHIVKEFLYCYICTQTYREEESFTGVAIAGVQQ